MQNKEREKQILSLLKDAGGFVGVRELSDKLYASESSIRRDLRNLAAAGLIKKSYGGAMPSSSASSITMFNRRARLNIDAKREIAKKASSFIKEGDVIFLDGSSTAFFLAEEIMNRSGLTVVTNNIEILLLLAESQLKVISSGGALGSQNRSCLVGVEAAETFSKIFADIIFFSVKGVDEEGFLTDCTQEETALRRVMFKNASKKIFLCDSSKFGSRAPFKQAELIEIDALVCEGNKSEKFSNFNNLLRL